MARVSGLVQERPRITLYTTISQFSIFLYAIQACKLLNYTIPLLMMASTQLRFCRLQIVLSGREIIGAKNWDVQCEPLTLHLHIQ